MRAASNTVVTIDYTLTDVDGEVLDTSEGREPLHYLHGHGNIIPGLEQAIAGRDPGDSLEVEVAPEQGYGERNEALVQEVPRTLFGEVKEVAVGMSFRMQTNAGEMIFHVTDLGEENVTIDGNHPLAGSTLNFAVEVKSVRDATEEELSHGHVHGPGGHHHHD